MIQTNLIKIFKIVGFCKLLLCNSIIVGVFYSCFFKKCYIYSMFRCLTSLFLIIPLYTLSQKMYSVGYANQSDLKAFVVEYENQCDLKVFKVDYPNQANGNKGHWYFVDYANQADKKIYFVEYSNQSDLKIYFVDYPNQSGWRDKSKQHLLY